MKSSGIRHRLEHHQIAIYFLSIAAAVATGWLMPGAAVLSTAINPALAVMLFLTFLQVPLVAAGRRILDIRFMVALLLGNFLLIPLLVWGLLPLMPDDPLIQFGALLVLLAPCIDYVITFSYLGKARASLLLAATPALLIVQMLMLPVLLGFMLEESAGELAFFQPLLHAFLYLLALPLALATLLQWCSKRWHRAAELNDLLSILPVPATALVLFIVIVSVVPWLGPAAEAALRLVPIYILYATCAPLIGWMTARAFKLEAAAGRAVAFSCGTRNSLVVLPIALSLPGAMPLVPAVIVTQTMVELLASLLYIRYIPRLGRQKQETAGP